MQTRYLWVHYIMVAGLWLSINDWGSGSAMRLKRGTPKCSALTGLWCGTYVGDRACCGWSGGLSYVQCYYYEQYLNWHFGPEERCPEDTTCLNGQCIAAVKVCWSNLMLTLYRSRSRNVSSGRILYVTKCRLLSFYVVMAHSLDHTYNVIGLQVLIVI